MLYLYRFARDPRHFDDWGHDLAAMFGNIAETAKDPQLRHLAWGMGREFAREWRRLHPHVPAAAGADEVSNLLYGSDAAERLGIRDRGMWREIRDAAARFTAVDYYGFDPVVEPPPSDIPAQCGRCSKFNARGARRCVRCGQQLEMRSRYDVWQDALIGTFSGDRYGVTLGAHLVDLLQWAPQMRPYLARARNPDFYGTEYAVTHLVYVLNDYTLYRLRPECLPEEFAFLRDNLHEAITADDPETVGEYLDTLQSFGLTAADPVMRMGIEYLLRHQNRDGSWDDPNWPDAYGRYHPTWTVIDGLREYNWRGTQPCIAP
jgi:hypothetical protein